MFKYCGNERNETPTEGSDEDTKPISVVLKKQKTEPVKASKGKPLKSIAIKSSKAQKPPSYIPTSNLNINLTIPLNTILPNPQPETVVALSSSSSAYGNDYETTKSDSSFQELMKSPIVSTIKKGTVETLNVVEKTETVVEEGNQLINHLSSHLSTEAFNHETINPPPKLNQNLNLTTAETNIHVHQNEVQNETQTEIQFVVHSKKPNPKKQNQHQSNSEQNMTLHPESLKPISKVVVDTSNKSIETTTIDYPILLSPSKYKILFEPQLDIQPYLNWIMPSEKPSRPPKILISDPFPIQPQPQLTPIPEPYDFIIQNKKFPLKSEPFLELLRDLIYIYIWKGFTA
jgi:hypothetical protein